MFGTEAPLSAADMEMITADNQDMILRNQETLLHGLTVRYDQVRKELVRRQAELADVRTELQVELRQAKTARRAPDRTGEGGDATSDAGLGDTRRSRRSPSPKSPHKGGPKAEPSVAYLGGDGASHSATTVPLTAEQTVQSLLGEESSTRRLVGRVEEVTSKSRKVSAEELERMLGEVEHRHTEIALTNFMHERLLERTAAEIVKLQNDGGGMQEQVEAFEGETARLQQEMRGTRLQTKQLRRDIQRQEAAIAAKAKANQRRLEQRREEATNDDGISQLLRLNARETQELMRMLEADLRGLPYEDLEAARRQREEEERAARRAKEMNRQALLWVTEKSEAESPDTRALKKKMEELVPVFARLGALVGAQDPEEIADRLLKSFEDHKLGLSQKAVTEAEGRKDLLEQQMDELRRELLEAKVQASAGASAGAQAKPPPTYTSEEQARLDDLERKAERWQGSWSAAHQRLLRMKSGLGQVLVKLRRLEGMVKGNLVASAVLESHASDGADSSGDERDDVEGVKRQGDHLVGLSAKVLELADKVVSTLGPKKLAMLTRDTSRRYSDSANDGVEMRSQHASRQGSLAGSLQGSRAASRRGSLTGSQHEDGGSPERGKPGPGKKTSQTLLAVQENLEEIEEMQKEEEEGRQRAEAEAKGEGAGSGSKQASKVGSRQHSSRDMADATQRSLSQTAREGGRPERTARKAASRTAMAGMGTGKHASFRVGMRGDAGRAKKKKSRRFQDGLGKLVGVETYDDASDGGEDELGLGPSDPRWVQWESEFHRHRAEADARRLVAAEGGAFKGAVDRKSALRLQSAKNAEPLAATAPGRAQTLPGGLGATARRGPKSRPGSPGPSMAYATPSPRGPYRGAGAFEKNRTHVRMEALSKRLRLSPAVARVLDSASKKAGDGSDDEAP